MKVTDVVEILEHWHAGRRMGELSSSLAVDPKTVRKYVAPALATGLTPGGPVLSREQWSALAADWFPELVDSSSRQASWPEIETHRAQIVRWLEERVTVTTIHQRLRDDAGLLASESSVRRWINANLAEEATRSAVRVLRDTPPAGEEAQVDYGLLGRWFDPATERWRRVWGFIMVLAFSRLMFLRPVLNMDQRSWVEAHVLAFEHFGGYVGNRCQDTSSLIRSSNPSKIFCLPIWPFFKASSRWRSSVGLNSMVVMKNEQDSQIDSKWQSISTGRAQYPLPSMRRSISLRSLAISFPSSAAGRAFGWS